MTTTSETVDTNAEINLSPSGELPPRVYLALFERKDSRNDFDMQSNRLKFRNNRVGGPRRPRTSVRTLLCEDRTTPLLPFAQFPKTGTRSYATFDTVPAGQGPLDPASGRGFARKGRSRGDQLAETFRLGAFKVCCCTCTCSQPRSRMRDLTRRRDIA